MTLPSSEAARIVTLYDDGQPMREIARQTGKTRQAVASWLIRHGYHVARPCNVLSEADRRRMVDWYNRGIGVEVIFAQFKIDRKVLYRELRRQRVPLRYPAMSRRSAAP